MDAGRKDEEGQAEVGDREQDGGAIATTDQERQPDDEADDEDRRPDQHAGHGPEQRRGVGRPTAEAGLRHRGLIAHPHEGPRVEGVDGQVGIRPSGLAVLDDQARQVHAERRDDQEQDAGTDGRRRDEPPDARFAVAPGAVPAWAVVDPWATARQQEMTAQQDDRHGSAPARRRTGVWPGRPRSPSRWRPRRGRR